MAKRYFRTHQKYGLELPKTVKRALEIDKETGTTHWRDAIHKEMKGVGAHIYYRNLHFGCNII